MRVHQLLGVLIAMCGISLTLSAQGGEAIFKATCSPCHSIGKGKLVGPDLKNVYDRHSEEWLMKWITSSQALVTAGDTSAVRLFKENDNMIMPDATISADEIKEVIAYFKTHPGETKTIAHAKTGMGEHGHLVANPETHADIQAKQHTMLDELGFGGYLSVMLGGLTLVVIGAVILKKRSDAESGL